MLIPIPIPILLTIIFFSHRIHLPSRAASRPSGHQQDGRPPPATARPKTLTKSETASAAPGPHSPLPPTGWERRRRTAANEMESAVLSVASEVVIATTSGALPPTPPPLPPLPPPPPPPAQGFALHRKLGQLGSPRAVAKGTDETREPGRAVHGCH